MSISKTIGLVALGVSLSATCLGQQSPAFREKAKEAQALYQQQNYLSLVLALKDFSDENLPDAEDRRTLYYLLAMTNQRWEGGNRNRAIEHAKTFMATKPSRKDPRYREMRELSEQPALIEEIIETEIIVEAADEAPLVPEPDQPTEEIIFQVVERMPEPEGGIEHLASTLAEMIRYPEMARKAKVAGVVFVGFVINSDGHPSDVTVLRGLGYGLDEEAIRVIRETRWIPGRQGGRTVRVRYSWPVRFTLPKP